MRAIQFIEYGDPTVLHVAECINPSPADDEILIKVDYAGVNFAEVMFRRGQFPVGVPHIPGLEVCGRVVEVGVNVTRLTRGQRVAALTLTGGGNAELVLAPGTAAIPLEGELAGLSDAAAAATPCNVTTAWGLLDAASLQPGERVLILAAAGGVGSAAVQLAKARGAVVLGAVGSDSKKSAASRWGCDHVLTYAELPERVNELVGESGVDVILDSVGGKVRESAMALLSFGGRHVIFGDAADKDVQVATNTVWFNGSSIVGYNLGGLAGADPKRLREHLTHALAAVSDGTVVVDITTVPFADVANVHELLESRASTGKFVLEVIGHDEN